MFEIFRDVKDEYSSIRLQTMIYSFEVQDFSGNVDDKCGEGASDHDRGRERLVILHYPKWRDNAIPQKSGAFLE